MFPIKKGFHHVFLRQELNGRGEETMKPLFLLLIILFFQACSTHLPVAGVQAYNSCDYDKAIDIFTKTDKKEKDALLFDLAILSAAVHKGDSALTKQSGEKALQRMWSYDGQSAGKASLLSSEALRYYRGEPFEKAMAAMYVGIAYFNDGDYETARAAFTKAVFAVQTKDENVRPDFAAPYLLLSKTYLKLKDEDNARIILNRLKDLIPNHQVTIEHLKQIHTIVFTEIGKGPLKFRTGPGDSLIGWQRQAYYNSSPTLQIDGVPIKVIFTSGDDLAYQAATADRKSKTAIQATKGVLRDAATITAVIAANEAANRKNATAGWVALGAGIFALANQSQADLRQWELLPDRLDLLFSIDPTTPGRHAYSLSTQPQVWYDDRTLEQDKIYIVSGRNCGNKPL